MNDPIIRVTGLTKRYRDVTAVEDVSFSVERDGIYGLLGRNGAGKSTLLGMLTAQLIPSSGQIEVLGRDPYENQAVQEQICYIKESQKYPDDFKVKHVIEAASWFFPNWSQDVADGLIADFNLPRGRPMKKLSRGMLSSVAIVVGLAARAPLSFFDEPYIGLDAVARQMFYDHLLAEYSEHPRTIIISTHLIDEVADMLSHVIVIDQGRVLMDAEAESLRGTSVSVSGTRGAVDTFVADLKVLHRRDIGGLSTVAVTGPLDAAHRSLATKSGLEITPVSLQQLIVNATTRELESVS